ncbi:hypothetical protein FACS1894151_10990 [Spirochaetia bacterium]|nr:hypothetical protein FACS1894151_10990 [Spirochaetia bacterium]
MAKQPSLAKEAYLAELKRFYNGYRFSEKPLTVYNPFGLLNHFNRNGLFKIFWYETGTPTFLIKLIRDQKIDILNLEKKAVHLNDFFSYDVDNMEAVPVLYQSGYLTIVDYDEEWQEFTLDYPNEEVRASFAKSLIEQKAHNPHGTGYIYLHTQTYVYKLPKIPHPATTGFNVSGHDCPIQGFYIRAGL